MIRCKLSTTVDRLTPNTLGEMIVLSVTQLEETEQQYTHAERRIQTLTCNLDEKGKELNAAAQKLQESLSTSTAHETTIKQLEQDMQRYAQTHPLQAIM